MTCSCATNQQEDLCFKDAEGIDLSLMADVIATYGHTKGSLITILQKVQDIYGFLPRQALTHLCTETGLREAQVYGVATFYTQFRFKPVGKYLIMLCQGTACHVNGSAIIEKTISEHLGILDGETTEDGLFTLHCVACLGCCSLAPVMMINGETYAKLTAEKTVSILDQLKAESEEVQA